MTSAPITQGARIFLADDHPAVLDGLTLLLAQDNHVICGVATCLEEAMAAIDESRADIAMVDLSLCGESGLDLIPVMVERNIPVLVYSMHEDAATQQRAADQGASGYVTKREPSGVLLEAVHRILAGERYVSPRAAANLEAGAPAQGVPLSGNSVNTKTFSERERQIWTLLAQGESNVDIAAALKISVRTVESYYTRMMAKLELDGIKALRKLAISESRLIF
ncbi:response regulator [Desulfovibrio ferrophilus]|uniref:Response regulator receiver n=1 Tax=Desulfovibrio ferrophilus TaxID=241368 RepID=A0A2Z6B220_9BACT|nr:response regulator transcription factor [Desulfovibrio ferrophilus]BBD09544.1 response regulator receiver [Desulfovibrio ferrophilus]